MSLLDHYSEMILAVLSKEGRLPISHLAQRVGLSKTPCQSRVKKLETEGYILGYKALLNYEKIGKEQVAYAQVTLSDTRSPALEAFNVAIREIPEVEECYMIAGAFDYLVKIRSADMNAYRKILGESLSSLPYVSSTSTFVSMMPIKEH